MTSLNIQAGSNNDRYIWRHSQLRKHFKFLHSNTKVTEGEGLYFLREVAALFTPKRIFFFEESIEFILRKVLKIECSNLVLL